LELSGWPFTTTWAGLHYSLLCCSFYKVKPATGQDLPKPADRCNSCHELWQNNTCEVMNCSVVYDRVSRHSHSRQAS
jgi:hypothetical protein